MEQIQRLGGNLFQDNPAKKSSIIASIRTLFQALFENR